ncbi:MAG: hypothetical protein AABX38_03945 [Candidatus Micrarchaeota archaeon]
MDKTVLQRFVARVKNIRMETNRFFGFKAAGSCSDCIGGSCDKCKGKPSVSIYDSATKDNKMDSNKLETQVSLSQAQETKNIPKNETIFVATAFTVVPLNKQIILNMSSPNEVVPANTWSLVAHADIGISYLSMQAKINDLRQKTVLGLAELPSMINSYQQFWLRPLDIPVYSKLQNPISDTLLKTDSTSCVDKVESISSLIVESEKFKANKFPIQSNSTTDNPKQFIQSGIGVSLDAEKEITRGPFTIRWEAAEDAKQNSDSVSKKSETLSQAATAKSGLINGYTYVEILTTIWLRRLYGHLIGITDNEDFSFFNFPTKRTKKTRSTICKKTSKDDSHNEPKSKPQNPCKDAAKVKFKSPNKTDNHSISRILASIQGLVLVKLIKPLNQNQKELKVSRVWNKKITSQLVKLEQTARKISTKQGVKEFKEVIVKIEKFLVQRIKLLRNLKSGKPYCKSLVALSTQLKFLEELIKLLRLLRRKRTIIHLLINSKKERHAKTLLRFLFQALKKLFTT